jgi:hypothetical protein
LRLTGDTVVCNTLTLQADRHWQIDRHTPSFAASGLIIWSTTQQEFKATALANKLQFRLLSWTRINLDVFMIR